MQVPISCVLGLGQRYIKPFLLSIINVKNVKVCVFNRYSLNKTCFIRIYVYLYNIKLINNNLKRRNYEKLCYFKLEKRRVNGLVL